MKPSAASTCMEPDSMRCCGCQCTLACVVAVNNTLCFDTRVRTFVCEGRIWNLNLFELLLNYLLVVPPCLLLYLFLRISILFLNAVAFVSVFDIVAESYPRTRSII